MLSRILAAFSVILYFFHLWHNCYFKQPFYVIELDPYFFKGSELNPLSLAFISAQDLQPVNILNVLFNFVWLCISSWYTFDAHSKVVQRGFHVHARI